MTIDDIYSDIAIHKPALIYVCGKTSTGKSTFGRKLHDELDYQVIELEALLLAIVKAQGLDEPSTFRKVFYDDAASDEKRQFLAASDRSISSALAAGRTVVIEGAVANLATLHRILQPEPQLFLYFHPENIDVYIRNLTKRFMEADENSYGGLSLKFWHLIDPQEFKEFCKTRQLTDNLKASIRQYALLSQKESLSRLEEFRQKFAHIVVVTI